MKDKINFKKAIGVFLFLISIVAIIVGAIWSVIFRFRNPDMTEMRILLSNPTPVIISMVATITLLIGRWMVDD